MKRLIVALVAILATWLGGPLTAVAAVPASPAATYAYDGHHDTADSDATAPEQGPPTASDAAATPDAVDPRSHGRSARPAALATYGYTTYDADVPPVQSEIGSGAAQAASGAREADLRAFSGAMVAANFGPKSLGAAQRLRYEAAPYHGATRQGLKNAAPTNGQDVLDFSMQLKSTSPRRVGVDPDTGEFVIFDQTVEGVFHGHIRTWGELTGGMQSVLRKAGLVDRRGNIL